MLSQSVSTESGALNPDWVEKLMGWPRGWSSLDSISHSEILFWVMGFQNENDKRTRKILQMLRRVDISEEIQEAVGGFVSIQEAPFLLAKLCKYANRPDEARVLMACAKTFQNELRSVWCDSASSSTPYRPKERKQPRGKHTDFMQKLSRLLAFYGEAYWEDGSWENAQTRIAKGVKHRVDRLKAIGNGQVPAVAAAAFRYLSKGLL